jgi:hypothetical protein
MAMERLKQMRCIRCCARAANGHAAAPAAEKRNEFPPRSAARVQTQWR